MPIAAPLGIVLRDGNLYGPGAGLSWVPNGYVLTFGGFLLLGGRPRVGSSR